MRALVVEDHPELRQILTEAAAARGHAVSACADAEAAWAAAQEQPFELVLLDIGLPGVDGLELCRRLRGLPSGDRAAVLVLTGSLDPDDLERIAAAGADDYLAKPFAAEHLALRLAFAERRLARAAVEDRVERQARELALLDRVRTALAGELETGAVLRVVVEAVADAFGYTQVSLYLRDAAGADELVLQHQVGYDRVIARIPFTAGIAGRVARSGEPVLLPDVAAAPEFLGAIEGITSEVCVPLWDAGRVAGILNVERTGGAPLGEDDLRLLVKVAEGTGIALGRARLYAEARSSEARYRALIEQIPAVTYVEVVADGGPNLPYVSPQVATILGYAPDAYAAAYADWSDFVHPDDRATTVAADAHAEATGEPFRAEYRHRTHDGRWVWVHEEAVQLPGEAGAPQVWQGVMFDVTARKTLEERLAHEATHDPLTGLPNRALFTDRLAHAVAWAGRRGSSLAVLFIDLDDFKVVNDTLGHDAGDRLLVAVAGRIRGCLRPIDIAARLGGDEFAVLLEGAAAEEAGAVAARIAARVAAPLPLAGREMAVAASVGVALSREGQERPEELLRQADAAMYAAKRAGKGCHVVFAPGMDAAAWVRLDLEAELRGATARDELVLHYQPVLSLATDGVAAMEALVRWRHPTRGLLGPAEFVPLAEETGQIVALGRWLLEVACRQGLAWQDRYPLDPPLVVSVNLAARQLRDPGLVADIVAALDGSGLAPDGLQLELTEGALVEDVEAAAAVLEQVRALGVRVALDDFGSGYSGLGYLRRMPVDVLKLDRALVAGLGGGQADEAVARSVIELGRALGMAVTAEGVETATQLARARALGCARAQGFHIAPPLPVEEASAFLAARSGLEAGRRPRRPAALAS